MREGVQAPATNRWLIHAAGWLVPSDRRAEWRSKWQRGVHDCWNFIQERPEVSLQPRSDLLRYCLRGVSEAAALRREDLAPRWRRFRNSAALPVAAGLIALAVIGVLTAGFASTRALFGPVSYRKPAELFVLWQNFGGFGRRLGVPAATIQSWEARSTRLAGVGAYHQRKVSLSQPLWRSEEVVEVRVSPGLFPLLGVQPHLGRSFVPMDAHQPAASVLLSHAFWTDEFRGDPGAVGRRVKVNGRDGVIIGVMPRSFAFPSRAAQMWTVFPLWPDPPRDLPNLLGGIARLQPGVTAAEAKGELRSIAAERRGSHWNGALVEITELATAPHQAVQFLLFSVPFAAILGTLLWRLLSGRSPWRVWIYVSGKIVIASLVLLVAWLELMSPLSVRSGSYAVFGWASSWFYSMLLTFLVALAILDQRRRCPVCLRRLTMPITIGSWSSWILNPVSTELVCDQGHGTLYVPGMQSTYSEPEHWEGMDESWRDLFETEKNQAGQT